MVNLPASHQKSEVVKKTEDGETRLVDGQNDGSAIIGHPDWELKETVVRLVTGQVDDE